MRKLRLIQVGSGGWGKSWLEYIHHSECWELAALVSRGGPNLAEAQATWHLPDGKCFTDIARALQVPSDAVLITTPHPTHIPFARKALEAGRHLLIEKPLADDLVDAQRLAADYPGDSPLVQVSQNLRNREWVWQLRKAIQDGMLGEVDSIQIDFRQFQGEGHPSWRLEQASITLLEIAIHHFDMCRFLLHDNASVMQAHNWNPGWSHTTGPAATQVHGVFGNGTRLLYTGSWSAHGSFTPWEGDWVVQGSKAAALVHDNRLRLLAATGNEIDPPCVQGFPGFDRAGILHEFAECIREGRRPSTNLQDNLNSLAMVFAALQSGDSGRPVILADLTAR